MRRHCGHSPDYHFVVILVQMTKMIGQMGGGCSDTHIPLLGYTPVHQCVTLQMSYVESYASAVEYVYSLSA